MRGYYNDIMGIEDLYIQNCSTKYHNSKDCVPMILSRKFLNNMFYPVTVKTPCGPNADDKIMEMPHWNSFPVPGVIVYSMYVPAVPE